VLDSWTAALTGAGAVASGETGSSVLETTTGMPSMVVVPITTGSPVSYDPSGSSVTVACSMTITLSVTTSRRAALFRTSYRPARASLASKEVAKMAKVEKVEERIAQDEVHDLNSLLLLLLSEMRVVIKTLCVAFFRRGVRGGKKVSRSWKRKNWGVQRT